MCNSGARCANAIAVLFVYPVLFSSGKRIGGAPPKKNTKKCEWIKKSKQNHLQKRFFSSHSAFFGQSVGSTTAKFEKL